jgi:pimeloyl-ACP methyl ester carboxylesterase
MVEAFERLRPAQGWFNLYADRLDVGHAAAVESPVAVDRTMLLSDGRTLGWAEYGDPQGRAVLAVHGSPDSRRIWALFDGGARGHRLRLVCPDRPGFGLSDPNPAHSVLGWVDDLRQLVETVGLDRFPVIAISGGGEYGCAATWRMPERVVGLGLFSVIGPLDEKGSMTGVNRRVKAVYAMARFAPWLLRPIGRAMVRSVQRNPAKAYARMAATRPPEDREVFARPAVRAALLENLPEQFRDVDSIVREFRIAVRPWPVPLGEIGAATHVWQGGRDNVHTPAMAERMRASIPGATLTLRSNFATFSFLDDLDPILDTLASWCERQ